MPDRDPLPPIVTDETTTPATKAYPCIRCGSVGPCPHDPQPLTPADEAKVRVGLMGGPAVIESAVLLVDQLRGKLVAAEQRAARLARAIQSIQGRCGHPDPAQACRNVLAVAGEALAGDGGGEPTADDPWQRVTDDPASLPPAGERVRGWGMNNKPCWVTWYGGHFKVHGTGMMAQRHWLLAWRREAGPAWLTKEQS